MSDTVYHDMFPVQADTTEYRKLTSDYVSTINVDGKEILKVDAEAIRLLTKEAFKEISHKLRPAHMQSVRNILDDPEASDNDRFVAMEMIKNAVIAVDGILPLCQDTGTAIVMGKRGKYVWTEGQDEEAISKGVSEAFTELNLRYSQVSPVDMYEEVNTGNNLPAQIDLYATEGNAYKFMFMAKGGGSANKTFLFQQTKALLNPKSMMAFLDEKIRTLGTSACPPYHLAITIGGTSAETCLKTTKLASAKYLDNLPTKGGNKGQAYRDLDLEAAVLKMTQNMGIGAQFGGKYFCHDVRVIRLPRHGASCPVSIGVSCSADRQVFAKITSDGVFIEKLCDNPVDYLPVVDLKGAVEISIDLNQPMDEIRKTLSQYPIKTRVKMTGTMIVARDIAHAKLKELLDSGKELPQYFKDHPVYYAGPAKTPAGYASGSFGPTTAGRMDAYVDLFQANGGSMLMVAKGNRSQAVTDACKKHGGFYLGSIGGVAAELTTKSIKKMECLEYPELGMEAIWKIEVEDFPAFIIVDDKGNDFFKEFV
jgi:fumarate hydratase, class I